MEKCPCVVLEPPGSSQVVEMQTWPSGAAFIQFLDELKHKTCPGSASPWFRGAQHLSLAFPWAREPGLGGRTEGKGSQGFFFFGLSLPDNPCLAARCIKLLMSPRHEIIPGIKSMLIHPWARGGDWTQSLPQCRARSPIREGLLCSPHVPLVEVLF